MGQSEYVALAVPCSPWWFSCNFILVPSQTLHSLGTLEAIVSSCVI